MVLLADGLIALPHKAVSFPLNQRQQAADDTGKEAKEGADLIRAELAGEKGALQIGRGVPEAEAAADPRRLPDHLHRQLVLVGAEAGDHAYPWGIEA